MEEKNSLDLFLLAIDKIVEPNMLNQLWDITTNRLQDESDRQGRVQDRAHKLISYGFTIIAGATSFVIFTLPLHANFATQIKILLLITFVTLICFLLRMFHLTNKILQVDKYCTWNTCDLARVDLGGTESQQGYLRYITKAGWKIIDHNTRLNSKKMKYAELSRRYFYAALVSGIIFSTIIIGAHLLSKNI